MLKKNIYFILIVIFLISKNLFAYNIPNKKNSSIIDRFFKDGEYVLIEDEKFIPFLDLLNTKNLKLLESFPYKIYIKLEEERYDYKVAYFFNNYDDLSLNYIRVHWAPTIGNNKYNYSFDCIKPNKNDVCNGFNNPIKGEQDLKILDKVFFKGNYYSIPYKDIEDNKYCLFSRKYKLTANNEKVNYTIDYWTCSNNINSKNISNAVHFELLNSIKIDNNITIKQINELVPYVIDNVKKGINNKNKAEEKKKKEEEAKKKAEERKKKEEEAKKLAEEEKKEAERQKKLEEKKKELEKKRKEEEEKRRIEEELKRQAEEKKRKQEEERKKREAEEKRKKELQKNIQDSKSALSASKANQNKLITETKNLELQLREIKSANTINKINIVKQKTDNIYDNIQSNLKSFNTKYKKVEKLFKNNPETELNLIFNEFKLLNTQFKNQRKVIEELYSDIENNYLSKKSKFEKELRDKELTDAFMRSDQAYIYTYVPIGVAIVLLLILIWRWNSSGRQIAYLNNKIRDLEKNNEKSSSPTTQVSKSFDKIEKQEETITTSIKTPEKSNINEEEEEEEEVENKNIEEPISNEIKKLNNLIDDKTFMDKYQNAVSDLNSLRSFTDEFKVKGLERFSSQRVEEGVELEISQRIVDKAMFWLIEHPQTFELLILPGRDLWSRSRLLLQDTSRFGYLNFNGIFDLSEGEEFKLTNFAIVSVTDKKKYKIEQKGELILPKSN